MLKKIIFINLFSQAEIYNFDKNEDKSSKSIFYLSENNIKLLF